ncbi:MAG: single-stranded-DNA-specific exonuclease RecJ [bacterium]|nr:single-stranded-DNA-specific exonuclease RecJ [bacterium]
MINKRGWECLVPTDKSCTTEDILSILASNRGLSTLNGEILSPPYEGAFFEANDIPDFRRSIERIIRAKEEKERVAIYGDYDVDGVTSTAILAESFEKIGVSVEAFLPHREYDGYGLNITAVEKIAKVADLLVTIDNGSSAHQAINLAVKRGVDVVVIDHHVISEILPNALVVNPHRTDSKYPFPDLCAAGLAFKFARSLLAHFDREDEAKWLLDLAALGTIADRVPMNGENRHIVKFGLKVLAVTKRLGLIALMARSGIYKNNLDAEALAFKIIPRLNAAGRMQHADLAYTLIRTKDHLEAEKLTLELDALNNSRRAITSDAIEEIKEKLNHVIDLSSVIFVAGNWPIGILGILAGKLADEYGRPAAVVNVGEEISTGSIRGDGLVDIMEILSGTKKILTKYGGHFTAGGFSFLTKNLVLLSQYFNELKFGITNENKVISYDLEIGTSIIDLDFVQALKCLEPHGEGNSKPIFMIRNLEIREMRDIGSAKEHKRFVFYHPDFSNGILAGVAFNWKKEVGLSIGQMTDVLCELKINEFRGNITVDIMLIDMRVSD